MFEATPLAGASSTQVTENPRYRLNIFGQFICSILQSGASVSLPRGTPGVNRRNDRISKTPPNELGGVRTQGFNGVGESKVSFRLTTAEWMVLAGRLTS